MGWSQVVHENRKKAELSRARTEFKQRKRGYDIELQPDAGMPALLALAGALSGAAWWRRSSRTLAGSKDWWCKLPVVQQVLVFLQHGQQPSRSAVRGKGKPKQVQPVRKPAALALPAGGNRATAGAGGPAASSGQTPASLASPTTAQRQASHAQASSSGTAAGAAKKKKAKKKKK